MQDEYMRGREVVHDGVRITNWSNALGYNQKTQLTPDLASVQGLGAGSPDGHVAPAD
jgi:hypothetical protein